MKYAIASFSMYSKILIYAYILKSSLETIRASNGTAKTLKSNEHMLAWYTKFAAYILSGDIFIWVFKNHIPIISANIKIVIEMMAWIVSDVLNTAVKLDSSFRPIS